MDLFNLNNDDFSGKAQAARKIDENLYNPGPDQGQNGIYKSVLRFVPYAEDTTKSKYKKYYSKLVNPLTNERLYIDCPSTNGKSSILWSLDKELKKLKEQEPQVYEELSKYFSRSYNYFSPVYIKKDPQNPTLEGKIKIFPFGYTIDNLIQQELNPESDIVTIQKINPYHLIDGKDFVLVVKRKTKTWRDFSSAKFMGEVSPLIITHNGKDIPISTDPKAMQFASEFLKKNTPDMSPYFFKEWTDADYEKVATFVKAIVPYKQILDNVLADLRDEKMKSYFTNSAPVIDRKQAPMGESLEYSAPASTQAASKGSSLEVNLDEEMAPAPAATKSTTKANQPADELDDLFADL